MRPCSDASRSARWDWRVVLAAVVVGVVLVAGCGGESASDDGGAEAADRSEGAARTSTTVDPWGPGANPAPAPAPAPTPSTVDPWGSGAHPPPAPAPQPAPSTEDEWERPTPAPAPAPLAAGVEGSPLDRLYGELAVMNPRAVASGTAGGVVAELDEYLLFGDAGIDAFQLWSVTRDLFWDSLAWDENFARLDRAEALAGDPRSLEAVFATALCATSVYRGKPDQRPDGRMLNAHFVDAHDVRVLTLWWVSYADGDATPSGSVRDLSIGMRENNNWWWIYWAGPREPLTPEGVAGEVQRCEPTLDAAALADEAAALASPDSTAAEVAATVVGLLRFAAPSATVDLGEWERVVGAATAPQFTQRAVAEARLERQQLAEVGIRTLLRAPVCYIERPAAALAGDGLGLERLVDLLIEQWYLDEAGTAHNVGPFLTSVPMARGADGRWVQYADRQDVVSDTSTDARAAAIRRHLANCSAF